MKSLSILGSTGSVGTQTLDVVRHNPGKYKVAALSCSSRIDILMKQIEEFSPEVVCVFDEKKADMLKAKADVEVVSGMKGLISVSRLKAADTVVNSLVGSIGVMPTIEAINAGKNIALANKETLVTAGEIVMDLVKSRGVELKPIDSEHSAIFQCLQGESMKDLKRLIITCSGGAFRDWKKEQLSNAKARDALKHPNWDMGNKITIDSATLMNKGFEVIEAKMLFGVDYENIDVVLHPQSIIHSLVEYSDTSVIAQLGWPDMKIPIQYALSHPGRIANGFKPLDLVKVSRLDFRQPDLERFPCLGYAYEAGRSGGTMPAVVNAANEIAVAAFLKDRIGFMDIPRLIREAMDSQKIIRHPDIDDILETDKNVKSRLSEEVLVDD